MIRLYILLGIIAIASLALWRYNYVITDRDQLKNDLATANATISSTQEALDAEVSSRIEADKINSNYLSELGTIRNENSRLRSCIADKSCVAVVRVKSTCPVQLPGEDSSGRHAYVEAELDPQTGQDILNLRESIKTLEADYRRCHSLLLSWEWPPAKENPNE